MPDIDWKSKQATQEYYEDVEGEKTLQLRNIEGWWYCIEAVPGGGLTYEGHKDVKWILLNSLNQRHKIVDDTIQQIKKTLGASEPTKESVIEKVIELGEALKSAAGDTKP
jgi:hypothetical protein